MNVVNNTMILSLRPAGIPLNIQDRNLVLSSTIYEQVMLFLAVHLKRSVSVISIATYSTQRIGKRNVAISMHQ